MARENYNEYMDNESVKEDVEKAITRAKLDDLTSEILSKKVDFKTPDSINHFYELDQKNGKVVFKLDQVKNYLEDVHKRLSGMKVQKFGEVSKENNFTGTILAIQIALKAMETDPKKPRKYYLGRINGEYDEPTKGAIKQFQTDFKLQWKDGKPGKETIGRLVKELDNLINNKRLEISEQEALKTDVTNIVEESIGNNGFSGPKKDMIDYILKGDLNSGKNLVIEAQIKMLAGNPLNHKLKYLVDNSNRPLQIVIQEIKGIRSKKGNLGKELTGPLSDKYTFGHNLTEAQKSTISNVLGGWGSPVTAEMVADSCQNSKNVPVEYLLGFMQNDSRVGTVGQGATTHNPGNVGNTGKRKKDRGTRERGVDACAENLQKRIDAYQTAKSESNKKHLFNDFPSPEELATGKSKGGYKFFGVYMTAPSGPKKVAGMVRTWVNRLKN